MPCTGRSDSSSDDIGDFIIRREDGTSAFFFCNAVDDSAMGVTQVLRGDDHLTNTPRQLMLLDALGMRRPAYGHVGLLVGDGWRAACRSGTAAPACRSFASADFLTAAMLNHLFRSGPCERCRRLAAGVAICRRISGRSIWAARRRASMSRN